MPWGTPRCCAARICSSAICEFSRRTLTVSGIFAVRRRCHRGPTPPADTADNPPARCLRLWPTTNSPPPGSCPVCPVAQVLTGHAYRMAATLRMRGIVDDPIGAVLEAQVGLDVSSECSPATPDPTSAHLPRSGAAPDVSLEHAAGRHAPQAALRSCAGSATSNHYNIRAGSDLGSIPSPPHNCDM